MTTADALARAIADRLLESRKDYRMVPHAGTLADLLRDYERAMVNEELAAPAAPAATLRELVARGKGAKAR